MTGIRLTAAAAMIATLLVCTPAGAQASLVSYYRFDDASGTVAWDSAGTSSGTVSGGAAFVEGPVGWALSFDGVDDAVSFPQTFPFNEPGDATLLLWIGPTDDHHAAILWSRDGNGYPDANRFHLFSNCLGQYPNGVDQAGIGFDYREEDGNLHNLLCAPGFDAGTWNHLAITRRSQAGVGDVYTAYVNGVRAAEGIDAAPVLPTYRGTWVAGTRHDPFMFAGAMDELALCRRALTAAEVTARYQRSSSGLPYEGCNSWSLAGDFRLDPQQANPSPDACGTPVWSYLWAPANAFDPATYSLFDRYTAPWLGPGTGGWHTDGQLPEFYCFGGPCLPIVAFNGSGADIWTDPQYWWQAGTVVVHPGYTQPVVVDFQAPFTGKLAVDEAAFTTLDWKCSDGMDWAVQLRGETVASGTIEYWSQPTDTYAGVLDVRAGDLLHLVVGPRDHLYCDSTQLGLRLHKAEQVVAIDVKPGSAVNPIQLSAKGVVPVAVLGAADLDAATVDPASLVFAGAPVARLGSGGPQASLQDVDGDGQLDLVAKFPTTALMLEVGDAAATLAGALRDGTPIRGQDVVLVKP